MGVGAGVSGSGRVGVCEWARVEVGVTGRAGFRMSGCVEGRVCGCAGVDITYTPPYGRRVCVRGTGGDQHMQLCSATCACGWQRASKQIL